MKRYAPIGPVSHATVNPEHLIPMFCDQLRIAMRDYEWQGMTDETAAFADYRQLIKEAMDLHMDGDPRDELPDLWYALFDALNDFAPPYTYFGANEGDLSDVGPFGVAITRGSDYGFWPLTDDISLRDAADSGYRVDISDHGNVTLYDSNDREIWAVV